MSSFKHLSRVMLLCLCLVGFAESSAARDIDPDTLSTLKERFAAADKDHNGKLTRDECEAGMPRIFRAYDQIDSDKKGFITLDQIITFVANH